MYIYIYMSKIRSWLQVCNKYCNEIGQGSTRIGQGKLVISPSGGWDVSKVQQAFVHYEADLILSIPIGRMQSPDRLLWNIDKKKKKGIFSVRSGYKLVHSLVPSAGSSSNGLKSFWSRLWRINLPKNIIIFVWWGCLNAVPCLTNLLSRCLRVDSGFPDVRMR